jgi:hypothetical protein
MATLITISTASINYTSGTTDCQCSVAVDVPTIGTTYVGRSVSLASDDLGPDWTDADLCAAVAAKLGVPVSDVSVAPGPDVWEEAKAAKLAAAGAVDAAETADAVDAVEDAA